jgi:SSS family solute:Na+ symporter
VVLVAHQCRCGASVHGGGFVIGLFTSVVPLVQIEDFGLRLLVTAGLTTVIWVTVMVATPPESDPTLDRFYAKVRPAGPGWAPQRQRSPEVVWDAVPLTLQLQQVVAALALLFGSMFAVGGFLLLQSVTGWVGLVLAVAGGLLAATARSVGDRPYASPRHRRSRRSPR